MEILDENLLAKQIFKRYSTNPKDWNFIISTNSMKDGFFDATISNPNEAWQLKIDSIYKPSPIILGTRLDIELKPVKRNYDDKLIPFGYRKIDPPVFMNMFRNLSEEQDKLSRKNSDNLNMEFNSILNSLEPTVPTKGKNYLYGPFLYTNRNLLGKSNYEDNVSNKLSQNIKNKIKERYPGYG